jgi:hypothetical protein
VGIGHSACVLEPRRSRGGRADAWRLPLPGIPLGFLADVRQVSWNDSRPVDHHLGVVAEHLSGSRLSTHPEVSRDATRDSQYRIRIMLRRLIAVVLAMTPIQAAASTWCADFLAGPASSQDEMIDSLIGEAIIPAGGLECMQLVAHDLRPAAFKLCERKRTDRRDFDAGHMLGLLLGSRSAMCARPVPGPKHESRAGNSEKERCILKLEENHLFTWADVCALQALATRCSAGDACMLGCLASRKGEGIGGGCYHVCSEHGTGNPPGSEYREPLDFYQCYWEGSSCEVPVIPSGLSDETRCVINAMRARCSPLDACYVQCETSTLTPMIPGVATCLRVCSPSWAETPWLPEHFAAPPGLDKCGQ